MAQIRKHKTISYQRTEGSPTLVFLHGWVHNHTVWHKIVRKLKCGAILIDLVGHGNSRTPTHKKEYSIPTQAKIIAEIIQKEVPQSCILIGHSLGGMIAQKVYEQMKNKIAALILIDTSDSAPIQDSFASKLVKILEEPQKKKVQKKKMLDFSKKTSTDEVLAWMLGASHMQTNAWVYSLNAMLRFSNTRLPKIRCPTLLISGEQDIRTPLFIARDMAKKIPNAKLIVIHGAGHNVPLTHSEKLAKIINEYIRSLESEVEFLRQKKK